MAVSSGFHNYIAGKLYGDREGQVLFYYNQSFNLLPVKP